MDPVNTLFWNLVSGWKNLKSRSRVLVWTANLHISCIDDTIAPPLHLRTTTTTMVDYVLVLVLQKILSLSGLLQQNIQRKKIMDNRLAIFFFLLCSVSSSTVCLYTANKLYVHVPSLQHVESFTTDPFGRKYSWNDAEEDGGKKLVLAHVDMVLQMLTSLSQFTIGLYNLFSLKYPQMTSTAPGQRRRKVHLLHQTWFWYMGKKGKKKTFVTAKYWHLKSPGWRKRNSSSLV